MRLSNMISAVDLHACGEPGRVIVGGVRDVPGRTMFEKMQYLERHHDDLRKRMLREPRGFPAANCNLILPPTHPEADAGFVIMEQVEYPPMSGTNTICVATALLETGMVPMKEPVTELVLEAPAGLVRVRAECANGKVTKVTFRNVPAFAVHLDKTIEVPHLGPVTVDVAWGGMFYVIADAAPFGLRLTPDEGREIVRIGEMIKAATQEQLPVVHPENPASRASRSRSSPGRRWREGAHRKNAVIVSTGKLDWNRPATWTGAIDRSPCGTGHLREDGGPPRQGPAAARPGLPARRRARHHLHRPAARGNERRALPRGRPDDQRPRLDHGHRAVRRRCRGPVPRGLHGRRHLGIVVGADAEESALSRWEVPTDSAAPAHASRARWRSSRPR